MMELKKKTKFKIKKLSKILKTKVKKTLTFNFSLLL
jgi:hypothetical protein